MKFRAAIYFQPRLRERTTQHYANGGYALEEVVLRDPSNPASGFLPFHRQLYDQVNVPFRWADSHDYAVYVQDAWRPFPRLTVSAGVRADVIGRKDAAFNVETAEQHRDRSEIRCQLPVDARRPARRSRELDARRRVLAQTTQSAGIEPVGVPRPVRHRSRRDLRDDLYHARRVGAIDRSRARRCPPPAAHQ